MGRAGKKGRQPKQSAPDGGLGGYGFGGYWQGGAGWDFPALQVPLPPLGAPWPVSGPAVGPGGAAATESLLDALADSGPATAQKKKSRGTKVNYNYDYSYHPPPQPPQPVPQPLPQPQQNSSWVVAPPRDMKQPFPGFIGFEVLLGNWVDTQGSKVCVMVTDAYAAKLLAVLSRPSRPEIHLSIRPVMLGGGWQCGHSLLDPAYSSVKELHWVTLEGKVSVWVRRPEEEPKEKEGKKGKDDAEKKGEEKAEKEEVEEVEEEAKKEAEEHTKETKKEADAEGELREPAAAEAAAAAQADQAEATSSAK